MPRRAAILVSIGGGIFSDPVLLSQMLLQASANADEISLVIGDSLNRWNLLPICNDNKDLALQKAIQLGQTWLDTFRVDVERYLGEQFKGVYRWEDWRNSPDMSYEQKRKDFDSMCSKRKVIQILHDLLCKYNIKSKEDFSSNSEILKKERGLLLVGEEQDKGWEALPWENAIAATILEYALRHFSTRSESLDAKDNFSVFLIDKFFPNAYEHQVEEAVMLYCCLIPADIKFNILYYPNKIAPIFKKAHITFAESEKLMYWKELKVNSAVEDKIERVINQFLSGVGSVNASDKKMISNLIRPLFAFVETKKHDDQKYKLYLTLSGLCSVFPQFQFAQNVQKPVPDTVSSTVKGLAQSSSGSFGATMTHFKRPVSPGLNIIHSPAIIEEEKEEKEEEKVTGIFATIK